MHDFRRCCTAATTFLLAVSLATPLFAAESNLGTSNAGDEIEPLTTRRASAIGQPLRGRFSDRTLVVGIQVDRDQARVLSYTVKERPFVSDLHIDDPRPPHMNSPLQLEIVLSDAGPARYTRRIDVGPICVAHGPEAPDHVLGDTIVVHRDAFLVELPEVAGLDHLETAYYPTAPERKSLGTDRLDRARFSAAGGPALYTDLAFSDPDDPSVPAGDPCAGQGDPCVIWPEAVGDTDIYRVYGDEAEGTRRIAVTIVPDGYSVSQKATMESHADSMVATFRAKTPYKEHDAFVNYTLVYAYSGESGTDECDCGIEVDTAMGTRFPDAGDSCGGSGNRCLYYGSGCDASGIQNIVATEMRAPFHDITVVMVNTSRYGGCGGARAVYSAANSSATEVAVHELGHSLGGLADEYDGNASCSASAGEINTSANEEQGAWPEWIAEIGSPREGAQYYNFCRYRPESNCEMRALFQPFCRVCQQHWSLVYFAHPRVSPTAPIESITPDSPVVASVGAPQEFAVQTRLATGAQVTNSIEWYVDGPGFIGPTLLASGTEVFNHTFAEAGSFTVRVDVVADTNFVKPQRYGANAESAIFDVEVEALFPPVEVSPPTSGEPLYFRHATVLFWENASASGASSFNLYRGTLSDLPLTGYGACLQNGITLNSASDPAIPPSGTGWFYLVSGVNAAGEGPLGFTSGGAARISASPCD